MNAKFLLYHVLYKSNRLKIFVNNFFSAFAISLLIFLWIFAHIKKKIQNIFVYHFNFQIVRMFFYDIKLRFYLYNIYHLSMINFIFIIKRKREKHYDWKNTCLCHSLHQKSSAVVLVLDSAIFTGTMGALERNTNKTNGIHF